MYKEKAQELVSWLGWEGYEGLNSLENEDNETLEEYIKILMPDGGPNEPERIKQLSCLGINRAREILSKRKNESQ